VASAVILDPSSGFYVEVDPKPGPNGLVVEAARLSTGGSSAPGLGSPGNPVRALRKAVGCESKYSRIVVVCCQLDTLWPQVA
jgi:hypothetical protein